MKTNFFVVLAAGILFSAAAQAQHAKKFEAGRLDAPGTENRIRVTGLGGEGAGTTPGSTDRLYVPAKPTGSLYQPVAVGEGQGSMYIPPKLLGTGNPSLYQPVELSSRPVSGSAKSLAAPAVSNGAFYAPVPMGAKP